MLKRQYNEMFLKIRRIINRYDPVGLVGGGAPEDEYDQEVRKIIELFNKEYTVESLAKELNVIFFKSFGEMDADSGVYHKIAEDAVREMNA